MGKNLVFHIQNFQSIKDQVFEFSSLTSIVGVTDRGKSAIGRAVKALFYNEWEDGFLRRKTNKCTLTATFPDGYPLKQVIKEKSKSINSYTFKFSDGRKDKHIPKAGTKIPDELKLMGFDYIRTERDDVFNLNFQDQFEPLFLVAQSKPLVTSFFNTLFKITKYERALKKITSDSIKLNREFEDNESILKNKQDQLISVSNELEETKNTLKIVNETILQYDKCVKEIDECESGILKIIKISSLSKEIHVFRNELQKINFLVGDINTYLGQIDGIKTLTSDISNIIILDNTIVKLSQQHSELNETTKLIDSYFNEFSNCGYVDRDLQALTNIGNEICILKNKSIYINQLSEGLNQYWFKIQELLDLLISKDKLYAQHIYVGYLNRYIIDMDSVNSLFQEYLEHITSLIEIIEYQNRLEAKQLYINGLGHNLLELNTAIPFLNELLECKDIIIHSTNYLNALNNFGKIIVDCEGDIKLYGDALNQLIEYDLFVKSVIGVCPVCNRVWEG